ncbi:uncharacterized protein LOC128209791 [Mya arenaria]|uniref:uncharacterized protein LOC128209791 n=1 Tax=Mya arenaria TaxID=6604 RepID=UPI0022E28600|nr:uncharacterized protein LOC128209791 [Mya arenaria]
MGAQTLLFSLLTAMLVHVISGAMPSACVSCQKSQQCFPPDCVCCSDELRFTNVTLAQIPQTVFFTFDDAVTGQAAGFYRQLFDSSRKNPNGCPVTMTLFISHDNTQYGLVSEFHSLGMEIASHSVTHSTMNGSNFFPEAKQQKENLAKLAGIPIEEIVGWRSPYLKPAGDLQPDTLKKLGYTYDATLTFSKRSFKEKPPGPFTLDFGYPFECQVKPCPRHKHAGFWEIPVVSLMDYKQAYDCVYVDGCMNAPPDEEVAYKFLWDNFHNYYTTTRMPFGINMHPSWFYYPDRLKAMDRFIQKLVSLNDVYIVSANRVIEWLKRPTPLQDLHSFPAWACDGSEKTFNSPKVVRLNVPAPPPVPRSFIQWTRKPTLVYTPAPPTARTRTFTQARRIEPQRIAAAESRGQTLNTQKSLFTLDLTKENARQRQRLLDIRRRHQSPAPPPLSLPRRPDMTRLNRPNAIISPTRDSTQIQLLKQHEERLRQRQLLRERLLQQRTRALQEEGRRQRQRDLLEERQRQHKAIMEQRRQEQRDQRPPSMLTSKAPSVFVSHRADGQQTFTEKRVLWSPSASADMATTKVVSRADKRRSWVPEGISQETVKIWPHMLPSFKSVTRIPAVSGRGGSAPGGNIIQRIQNPTNGIYVEVTPAPSPTHTRHVTRFTESPQDRWHQQLQTRLGPAVSARPVSRQGSSARVVRGPDQSLLRQLNNHAVRPLRGHPVAGRDNIRAEVAEHSRQRSRVEQSRVSRRPSVRQQMAWNNFIQQMLGPH